MYNHCVNILQITGTPEDLREFREFAHSTENGHLDINNFIPTPQEFQDLNAPHPDLQSSQRLMEKYGATNRHKWACDNWGTGWGAYDTIMDEVTDKKTRYRFFTPSYPFSEECMTQVAARFPRLKFNLEFGEQGLGFEGQYILENGALTVSQTQGFPPNEEPEDDV